MTKKFCEKCGCSCMPTMRICPECGNRTFADSQTPFKAQQKSWQSNTQAGISTGYAGFWERGAAYLIDICIIYIFTFIFGFFVGVSLLSSAQSVSTPGVSPILVLIDLVAPLTYFSVLESGSQSATIGKRLMGIQVLTTNLHQITVGQAAGRNLGRLISTIVVFLGYFIQPFTAKKQTLHDMMAGTVVVRSGSKQHSIFAVICIFIAAFIAFAIILAIAKSIK